MTPDRITGLESRQEKMRRALQDHANDFMGLYFILNGSGIAGVREAVGGGSRVATVAEYLAREENKGKIGTEDRASSAFTEKSRLLDALASEINSSYEDMSEKRLREIIDEVKRIIYK